MKITIEISDEQAADVEEAISSSRMSVEEWVGVNVQALADQCSGIVRSRMLAAAGVSRVDDLGKDEISSLSLARAEKASLAAEAIAPAPAIKPMVKP